ncbi:hypothetical protein QJS04_geneDACA023637 [Acorus gramineus]|uniref:DHHA2 domain-containing protein n=1 Tax=Acorus gramineus TaxID=55184 RepID=A0AAV9A866_ACOGR|nr:hypothetical protein QJS04_geneDACA020342 [Acorus gramineus]KAK1260446.1 hypothetical protein QJS04_geneDACA023637 [Acorus gramineus]
MSEEVAPENGTSSKADYKVLLPRSAASFYGSNTSQTDVLDLCESVCRLNRFLKEGKAEVKAGVPGRFLHAVIGQEVADVGSVVSTITYAFFLNEMLEDSKSCTVPIINVKRADLNAHKELMWLLHSCRVEESDLIFIDEVDLSYHDRYGNLRLVLLNGDKLPTKQEAFKEALVEIFNCKQVYFRYSIMKLFLLGQDCSCCTIVAEKFAETSPETLAGMGFSRFLLAGILLDTGNLTDDRCTIKDKYMTTLLIKGAGRYGCSGLHQLLKHKMFDISDLKIKDILRKEFKKWKRVAGTDLSATRMSSIGISVSQLLSHEVSAAQEITNFQQSEKLRLLMVVSGYYDSQKNFKREILVSANTAELMKNFLRFLNTSGSHLPLKELYQPDLPEELRAFEIDNMMTSRKAIERLLEEFGGISN